MSTVKFDVSGSDPDSATRDFEQPKPGVYTAKIIEAKVAKPEGKDRRIEVVYEIFGQTDDKEKYNGARQWEYINLESEMAVWKLDQFLQAVGKATKSKRTGSLDTDELPGKKVKLRLVGDTNLNGDYRAKVGSVLMMNEDEDEEGDGDGDEEAGEDTAAEEPAEEETSGETPEASADAGSEYADMSQDELKAECAERELSTRGSRAVLLKRLIKDDENPFEE